MSDRKDVTRNHILKPCPFCGVVPRIYNESAEYKYNRVECINPECQVKPRTCYADTPALAKKFWNMRW